MHPRWCRISSINSSGTSWLWRGLTMNSPPKKLGCLKNGKLPKYITLWSHSSHTPQRERSGNLSILVHVLYQRNIIIYIYIDTILVLVHKIEIKLIIYLQGFPYLKTLYTERLYTVRFKFHIVPPKGILMDIHQERATIQYLLSLPLWQIWWITRPSSKPCFLRKKMVIFVLKRDSFGIEHSAKK